MFATRAMQIQGVAFLLFGLVFFLIPDIYNELWDWEGADSILGRIIGAAFIGLGWIELKSLADTPDKSTVLPFAVVPTLLVVAGVWERAAGTYDGSDNWFWVNMGIGVGFALLMWIAVVAARE